MYENNITRFYKNEENIDLIKDFEIWFEKNYEVFDEWSMNLDNMFNYTTPENIYEATNSWSAYHGETPFMITIYKGGMEDIQCFKSEKEFDEWKQEVFVYWVEDILTMKFKQSYNTYEEYTLQVMRVVYTWEYYKVVELINDIIESDEKVIKWIDICTR